MRGFRKKLGNFFPIPMGRAFTLFEIMVALSILSLIFTAVVVSLRSKWQVEQGRRGAQKVALVWLKARSYAWREGREWVVTWDARRSQLDAAPLETTENDRSVGGSVDHLTKELSSGFSVGLDPKIRLLPEFKDEELPAVHFLPNGRVLYTSLLVKGPKGDTWRVKINWDGTPTMEWMSGQK